MLTKDEKKFLDKIAESPGIAAKDLPRARRGETIKSLELKALIHFGPGGWYLTTAGEIARCEDVAAETGGIPTEEKFDADALAARTAKAWRDDQEHRAAGKPTFLTSEAEVKREARFDNALERWAEMVGNRAAQIDPRNEHEWGTLAYGFFLGLGFEPADAQLLAEEAA